MVRFAVVEPVKPGTVVWAIVHTFARSVLPQLSGAPKSSLSFSFSPSLYLRPRRLDLHLRLEDHAWIFSGTGRVATSNSKWSSGVRAVGARLDGR